MRDRRRRPRSEITAIYTSDECLPAAVKMPIEMNGDIGTSPLCGQPLVNANFAPADFEPSS